MASSNLLKEAIADAKAVRETAIANAKLALEEAFTPKLQSMLSNKIEEELDENEELEEQSDSSNIGSGDNKLNQASGDDEEKNAETKTINKDYGSEDANVKVVDKLTEADEDEKDEMEKDEIAKEADEDDEGHIPGHDDEDSEDGDMDMELEAIIKELEDEDNEIAKDEKDEMMKELEKSEMEKSEADEDEKDEMKEVAKDEKSEADEDEKDEIAKEEIDLDEELNIESILAALKEEDEDEKDEIAKDEKDEMEKAEMYKEQLEEAYDTIRSLKSTLNEVNLLNAKLLFSNKLFKSQSLTESQKLKVIETFDRAHSLREVKLVYTTLAESLRSTGSKTKKLRTEGLASKAQSTTKPKTVIAEGNEMASRMKKLAGLL